MAAPGEKRAAVCWEGRHAPRSRAPVAALLLLPRARGRRGCRALVNTSPASSLSAEGLVLFSSDTGIQ